MAKRYEKIEFKDFSGGGGQEFLDDEKFPKKFLNSELIDLDNNSKSIIQGPRVGSRDINIQQIGRFASDSEKLHSLRTAFYKDFYYTLGIEQDGAADHVVLHRAAKASGTLGSFSFYYDFRDVEGGKDGVYALISFKNVLIANFFSEDEMGLQYTTSSTPNSDAEWIHSPMDDFLNEFIIIIDYKIVDNVLYVLTLENGILQTDDGITWSQFLAPFGSSNKINGYKSFDYFKGFFHLIVGFGDTGRQVLMRLEGDELVYIADIPGALDLVVDDNSDRLLISTDNRTGHARIIEYDGNDLNTIYETNKISQSVHELWFCGESLDKVYFFSRLTSGTQQSHLFSINRDGGVFVEYEFASTYRAVEGQYVDGILFVTTTLGDEGDVRIYNLYDRTFALPYNALALSLIETSIVDVGLHAPVYFFIKHRALLATEEVLIYARNDLVDSWGSPIITNDTDGSIGTFFAFPKGTSVDFIEFKFVVKGVATTALDKFSAVYLYKPLGLEFSE